MNAVAVLQQIKRDLEELQSGVKPATPSWLPQDWNVVYLGDDSSGRWIVADEVEILFTGRSSLVTAEYLSIYL